MSQHSAQVVKLPSFQLLLEKYLPDDLLLKRHAELTQSDNEPVSIKAVELGYKVKRRLGNEDARDLNLNISFNNQPTRAVIDGESVDIYDKDVVPIESDNISAGGASI